MYFFVRLRLIWKENTIGWGCPTSAISFHGSLLDTIRTRSRWEKTEATLFFSKFAFGPSLMLRNVDFLILGFILFAWNHFLNFTVAVSREVWKFGSVGLHLSHYVTKTVYIFHGFR